MLQSLVIVIPARGGSKRVPGKNIAPLAGRPLICYTLDAVSKAALDAPVVVSTNDNEIVALARKWQTKVVRRPDSLATDSSTTESALIHALDTLSSKGKDFEWVMTLPPTSPFRSARTIRAFAAEVEKQPEAQDCLMSVHENRSDFWRRTDTNEWERLFTSAPRRQQDRTPLYEENSAIYISRVAALRATESVLGNKTRAVIIDPIEGFDINTPHDFDIAEILLARAIKKS